MIFKLHLYMRTGELLELIEEHSEIVDPKEEALVEQHGQFMDSNFNNIIEKFPNCLLEKISFDFSECSEKNISILSETNESLGEFPIIQVVISTPKIEETTIEEVPDNENLGPF